MKTRRAMRIELGELAEQYDALDDIAAENAIRELVEKELGQGDYLMALDLGRARKQRLAERNSRRRPSQDVKVDLQDLLPDEPHTPSPSSIPQPVRGRHLQKSLVAKKHGGK